MGSLYESYPAIREALLGSYGRSPSPAIAEPTVGAFGRLVGVLLARLIAVRQAEGFPQTLSDAGLLDPDSLAEVDPAELVQEAQSAGLRVNPKAIAAIHRLAGWVRDRGGLESLDSASNDSLRESLRALPGFGPATVDTLLLYGLDRPTYPVDRASYRVLVRHGWLEPTADYDEARDLLERLEPDNPGNLADLAHWMERLGSSFCKPSVAKCERCPLRPWLPLSGPIDPEG